MKKIERQRIITNLIDAQGIDTQEEIVEALRGMNISVTQATISRDLKELHMYKIVSNDGKQHYASRHKEDKANSDRYMRLFKDTVLSVESAYNQIVVKTLAGSANVAGEALDNFGFPEILGSIAGDNTILLILRSTEDVKRVKKELLTLLHRP